MRQVPSVARASLLSALSLLSFAYAAAGCGDDAVNGTGGSAASPTSAETTGPGGGEDTAATTGATSGPGGNGGGGDGGESAGGGGATSSVGSSSSSGAGGGGFADPNLDGPYATAETTDSITATDGSSMPIFAVYPTSGPVPGPYPVVVVAHGFQIPATQYASYVRRLATHGFVAITADYPAGFFNVSNVDNAADLVAALDWADSSSTLEGIADPENAGMTGHSMGGKLALLAASTDTRVKATITLDPVDGAMGCNPEDCPDVSDLMPLDIPTGFLGETTDASGSFQACAPAADNYATFYAGTTAPSLEVTVIGANHMSFIDDVAGCGFTCSLCNPATADASTVGALSRAYVVAFYRRWLQGEVEYDAYLTGDAAQARYIDTGLATLQSK